MLDPAVFKAYDVRGIYPTQLDEEGAYAIGRAYVEHFEPRSIAVGRDMRVSSPTMAAAVIEGAREAGTDVADIGLVVLGGGIGANGDLLLDRIRAHLADWLPYPPRVEISSLGEAAVLSGALAVGLRAALDNVFRERRATAV